MRKFLAGFMVMILLATPLFGATIKGTVRTTDGLGICDVIVTATTGTDTKAIVYKTMSDCGVFTIEVDLSGDFEVAVTRNGWLFTPEYYDISIVSMDDVVTGLVFTGSIIPDEPQIPELPSGCAALINGEYVNKDLGIQKITAFTFDNTEALSVDMFVIPEGVAWTSVIRPVLDTKIISKSITPISFDISYTDTGASNPTFVPLQGTFTVQKVDLGKTIWNDFRENPSVQNIMTTMKLCKIIDNEVYDLVSLVSPDMLDNFFIVDFRDTERILNITYRVGIIDGVPETDEEPMVEAINAGEISMFKIYDGKKDGKIIDPLCFSTKIRVTPVPTVTPTPTDVPQSGGGGGCNTTGAIGCMFFGLIPMIVLSIPKRKNSK